MVRVQSHDHIRIRRPSDRSLHAEIGFKESTIRSMIRDGDLASIRVRGQIFVTDVAVRDFLERASGDAA